MIIIIISIFIILFYVITGMHFIFLNNTIMYLIKSTRNISSLTVWI